MEAAPEGRMCFGSPEAMPCPEAPMEEAPEGRTCSLSPPEDARVHAPQWKKPRREARAPEARRECVLQKPGDNPAILRGESVLAAGWKQAPAL